MPKRLIKRWLPDQDKLKEHKPDQYVQLARFDGETWKLFGDILSNESA